MGAPVVASAPLGMPAHDNDAGAPHIVDRYTKSGRRLWYCLKVIQQPERARACGSGPKSSADRRPVDPPPVVELRIFEGQNWDQAQDKDITFLYNANFFLFATLEHARVMAHGRVQTPAAHTPPVLTGMPVSGMAYLDRPKEAGYFLFPDLSVRHEGRYKLTFNLYEETKEDKDMDVNAPETKPITPGLSVATGGSFDFRMEVKSQDFVVYSAKKFPGLAESTVLSRVVAEQGCRVRIRRDVRMRRRPETKNGGDYDAGAAAEDDFRTKRHETPDARPNYSRDRSMSGSVERTPYSNDPQRRTSMADYSPQYPPQSHGPGGHLQFLGGGSNSQFPPQLPQSFPPPPPPSSSVPASPVYTPSNQSSYSSQSSYPPPPPPPSTYSSEKTAPAPINPPPRRDSAQIEYRSMEYKLPPLPPVVTQSQYQSPQNLPAMKQTLPPLQNVSLPSPSVLPSPTTLSAVPRPPQSGPTLYPYSRPPPPAPVAGAKRPRDQTFRSETESRFQDGARDRGTAEDVEESQKMYYRRADGSLHDASNRD